MAKPNQKLNSSYSICYYRFLTNTRKENTYQAKGFDFLGRHIDNKDTCYYLFSGCIFATHATTKGIMLCKRYAWLWYKTTIYEDFVGVGIEPAPKLSLYNAWQT